MLDLMLTLATVCLIVGSAIGGFNLYRFLSEHHRSQASMDFVRMVAGLLTTFTALVLGLLLNEVNTGFNKTENDLRSYGAAFISLNTEMSAFGPQVANIKSLLQEYLRSAIVETWPDEPKPNGKYIKADISHDSEIDAENLEALLLSAQEGLRHLTINNEADRSLQSACLLRVSDILDQRWKLVSEAHATISSPLLVMMVLWLMVVFASFGVTAPRHVFSVVWIGVIALSVGGAIFTILELDGPLDGFVRVSSGPIRHALFHLEDNGADGSALDTNVHPAGRL